MGESPPLEAQPEMATTRSAMLMRAILFIDSLSFCSDITTSWLPCLDEIATMFLWSLGFRRPISVPGDEISGEIDIELIYPVQPGP